VRSLQHSILVALLVAALGNGCSRPASIAPKRVQVAVPTQADWGQAAEGLQCRARPARHTYSAGESPAFTVDLRNGGSRIFAFRSGEQAPLSRYSIDGHWRPWPGYPPRDGKVQALRPGVEVRDMVATLPQEAHFLLTPGRHVVQVAFTFEGVDVVSDLIEIAIIGPQ